MFYDETPKTSSRKKKNRNSSPASPFVYYMSMGRALGEARLRERELRAQVQNAIIIYRRKVPFCASCAIFPLGA